MSQMPQQASLSRCPSCAEPLESGDRFCGACGYDLSAVPEQPEDHPTLTMNGSPAASAADPGWPSAAGPDSSDTPPGVHLPTDIRGTDSGGGPLHPAPQPAPYPAGPVAAAAQSAVVPGSPSPVVPAPHVPEGAPPVPVAAPAVPPPAPAAAPAPPLAAPAPPAAAPAPPVAAPAPPAEGARFDHRAEPDEYPLQAPDPRVVDPSALGDEPTVCVACRAGRVDGDGYCENCGHAQPRERDHMEQECGPLAAVSDRGLRHHRNEDAFAVATTALPDGSPAVLAIVCDGVSSATRPDEASAAASQAAGKALLAALPRGTHPQTAMHEAILAASRAVNALAEEPEPGHEHAPHQNAPACTLVGTVVTAGLLVVGWVGDSRAYWVPLDRSAPSARLTEDDSWAAQMVAAGLMNEAEAYADERAHAITGWLGADAYELEPHTASFKPDRPGVVIVCTDGLWNYAEAAEEMAGAVPLDAAVRPLHSARVLVGHALDGGGHDNVTVAVVPFPAPPQGAGSA
ncbi:PP2C family serine/threonine-protein phosphatase [Streptomyces sp. NPDC006458]|uniref:PP2C family serine/threonine-protein phosphatase n=1 Tax=Streptomyces sp. NPDC006458 TaxID=3154302 RepID=UPI0033A3D8CD